MRRQIASHPQVVHTTLLALWSINERLAGREGLNITLPGMEWMQDLLDIGEIESEEARNNRGMSLADLM